MIKRWATVGIWLLTLGAAAVTPGAEAPDDPFGPPGQKRLPAAAPGPAKPADVPRPSGVVPKPATEAAIRQKLANTSAPSYTATPLQEVAQDLQTRLGIPVLLDRKALDNVGVGVDTPVTFRSFPHSAKFALAWILRNLGLIAVVREGTLLITSRRS